MVGLHPAAAGRLDPGEMVRRGQALGQAFRPVHGSHAAHPATCSGEGGYITGRPGHQSLQLSVVPPVRLGQLLGEMLSEDAFLSPHGLRALSRRHRDAAFTARARRAHRVGRLRARRIDVGAVRRQLELARPGLDADELPGHRVALELGLVHGRRLHGRVPDRLRGPRSGCATSPRTSPGGWSSIWLARRERPPAGLRRHTRSSRPTRIGTTCSGSTSTSTATPAPASAPRTRPAGRDSWRTCSAGAGSSTPSRAAARPPGWGWSRPGRDDRLGAGTGRRDLPGRRRPEPWTPRRCRGSSSR